MTQPTLKKITREEWQSLKRHGYTSTTGGTKRMLHRDPAMGGTVLIPVEIEAETEDRT